MAEAEKLKFKVAPHIVEDLGLNLYTNLPRVFVEFVANAYDADSPSARISLDKAALDKARRVMKREYELDKEKKDGTGGRVEPLASRTLPEEHTIVIEDSGCGMSREDLNDKFLVAGRRRLQEEPDAHGRSKGNRPLMGRKGLGKLAGFGVAMRIEVMTRKKGESHATRICLDYDKLVQKRAGHEIEIDDEQLTDGGGLPGKGGTRITLSRLLYDPLRSRAETIENAIAEYFDLIDPDEFAIYFNGQPVPPPMVDFAYAWPEPDTLDKYELVEQSLPREGGGEIRFLYRLRFTKEGEALAAARRGVRVYVNKRLAAMPSLLEADTNMHGFRMTDYLDGIVHAGFLASEDADYIATDRQSLRWESPLLSDMHEYLSNQIKAACAAYQKLRDETAPSIVKADPFTTAEIEKCSFSKRDKGMALRIAVILKNAAKRGVNDPGYKEKLPVFLRSIGHGNILTAISELADQPLPDIHKVAVQVARLTADEFDQFASYAKARLKAIQALTKIVRDADFEKKQNEKAIQKMLENSPWMINPIYSQFLSADTKFDVVLARLAKALKVGEHIDGKIDDDERPDLVFLLESMDHEHLVIVELKSANKPLESPDLDQLLAYMDTARQWLADHGRAKVTIEGQLIGSKAAPASHAKGVRALKIRIEQAGPGTPWAVRDYTKLLDDTMKAHQELLAIHDKVEKAAAAGEEREANG